MSDIVWFMRSDNQSVFMNTRSKVIDRAYYSLEGNLLLQEIKGKMKPNRLRSMLYPAIRLTNFVLWVNIWRRYKRQLDALLLL